MVLDHFGSINLCWGYIYQFKNSFEYAYFCLISLSSNSLSETICLTTSSFHSAGVFGEPSRSSTEWPFPREVAVLDGTASFEAAQVLIALPDSMAWFSFQKPLNLKTFEVDFSRSDTDVVVAVCFKLKPFQEYQALRKEPHCQNRFGIQNLNFRWVYRWALGTSKLLHSFKRTQFGRSKEQFTEFIKEVAWKFTACRPGPALSRNGCNFEFSFGTSKFESFELSFFKMPRSLRESCDFQSSNSMIIYSHRGSALVYRPISWTFGNLVV